MSLQITSFNLDRIIVVLTVLELVQTLLDLLPLLGQELTADRSASGSLGSILVLGGLLELFQLQRFLPQHCGVLLICAAVREEDRWIPVVLRLRWFEGSFA